MNLQELLRKRMIEKIEPDRKVVEELFKVSENNLTAAEDNMKTKHADWALAIAYNAMLNAGRAFMASKGYRPFSESHHIAIVQFCASLMPSNSANLVSAFNRYRVRRHNVVYGEAGSVGEDEARRAINNAMEFVIKIKGLCKR